MTANNEEVGESSLLHARFGDVDDFNETVNGWNLRFRQLDRARWTPA